MYATDFTWNSWQGMFSEHVVWFLLKQIKKPNKENKSTYTWEWSGLICEEPKLNKNEIDFEIKSAFGIFYFNIK